MPRPNKIAEDLCTLFQEALRSSVSARRVADKPPTRRECKECGKWFLSNSLQTCEGCRDEAAKPRTFADLDTSARKAFRAAARLCVKLDADPREFIVAQFAMWRDASAFHNRRLLPSPHHLGTLAAHVRYVQYKAREEARLSRKDEGEDEQPNDKRWFVEERTLNAIARNQRRDPIDILTEYPEKFSRHFLTYKGVWDVVSELWEERTE